MAYLWRLKPNPARPSAKGQEWHSIALVCRNFSGACLDRIVRIVCGVKSFKRITAESEIERNKAEYFGGTGMESQMNHRTVRSNYVELPSPFGNNHKHTGGNITECLRREIQSSCITAYGF